MMIVNNLVPRALGAALVVALTVFVAAPLVAQDPAPASTGQGDAATRDEARLLARAAESRWREIEVLLAQYAEAEGDERLIIDAQILRKADALRDELSELTDTIASLDAQGIAVPEPRRIAGSMLSRVLATIVEEHDSIQASINELVSQRNGIEPSEFATHERRISRANTELDEHFAAETEVIGYLETLGFNTDEEYAELDRSLDERAIRLSAEIQVASRRIDELEEQLGRAGVEATDLRAELGGYQKRFDSSIRSLTAVVELMKARGLQTAELRQQLIRATGVVTDDILDAEVAIGLLQQSWRNLKRWFAVQAPQAVFNLLVFGLILLGFKVLAEFVGAMVDRTTSRSESRAPQLLKNVARAIIRRALMLLGLLVALSYLGVQVGPLLAGLGIVGFIVGFALQDTLANFASGLMILVYRPFDLGDSIEVAGVSGRVHDLNLVSTTITTFDNRRVIIPNKTIWGGVICNITAETTRRIDLEFSTGTHEETDRVESFLLDVLASHDLVLAEPAAVVRLHRMTDTGATWIVRPWVKTSDYWSVYWDVTRSVKDRFRDADVEPPSPRQDVVLRQVPTGIETGAGNGFGVGGQDVSE